MKINKHNISLRQLRAFQAVASRNSFSKAAKAMHITPSALSELIRQLEDNVGTRLFDRTTRRVDLTHVGEQFIIDVKQILSGIDHSLQRIEDGLIGDGWVRIIGSPMALKSIVIPCLVGLREQFPKVRAELIEAGADEIRHSIEHGLVDFGVGSVSSEDQDNLAHEDLFLDRFCLVATANHPLMQAYKTKLPLSALQDCDFISLTDNTLIQQRLVQHAEVPQAVRNPIMRVSNPTLLRAALCQRLGVSILTVFACQDLLHDGLDYRLLDAPALQRKIQLLCQPARSLSPPAQIIWQEIWQNRASLSIRPGLEILHDTPNFST